ncbi:MAG: Uma2 family endonuclease [Acidobacteriaceae bacterium]|nr:Uma2 family endonuclease [Acidobacteriaceae bacterium]MBV8573327.1 Uma2 family endonuclease [Acidobacteriaceae bacterium]
MSAITVVPLGEYLSTVYRPDREYVDGQLLERNLGEWDHARLQGLLYGFLLKHEKEWKILVVPEQRVQVKPTRFRVPDITVLTGPAPVDIVRTPPFLCIEILSPDDRIKEMQTRIDDYLEFGVSYVWLIDPATRRATVYTRDGVSEVRDGILATRNPDIRVILGELD